MADKEEKIYLARLAEQAERYEEMVQHMSSIAKLDVGLLQEERNLLSVAFKNVIGSRRASWRIISTLELKKKGEDGEKKQLLETEYKLKIEKEMKDICDDILDLLDKYLIPSVESDGETSGTAVEDIKEGYVFYYKMKGDYLRYLAEFSLEGGRKEAAENSLVAYKKAFDKANESLNSIHPIRLGLALNFSVFYYEILNSPERACRLAKQAFDDAVSELDNLQEEDYKDSTLIMQLLRDNLTLWTSEVNGDEGEDDSTTLQDVEDN